MSKIYKIVFVTLILLSFSTIGFAKERPTFNDIIENGKAYDDKTITVQGEAVGEAMGRGAYTWINITDGTIPMGIWLKTEDAKMVKLFGDYHHKGDVIEVTGVFNRACDIHGGDMDIHANSISIIKKGEITSHTLSVKKLYISIGLTIINLILISIAYKKIKTVKNLK